MAAMPDDELLEAIGRKRGAVMTGGRVNVQKAAEIVITDFRIHNLGRITLETPAEYEEWFTQGMELDALRQAKKDARAKTKKTGIRNRKPAAPSA
ncbi:Ribosome biogenesis GTPase A [compost metagenome]